jgi:hypothetical protein
MKYLGTYNLSVPYELRKLEFSKETKHDIRIDCKKGFICRFGDNILKACFKSPTVKNNVLEKIQSTMLVDAEFNYYDFTFYEEYVGNIAKAMDALTKHKNRNPYSIKNLPTYGKYKPNNPELCASFSKMLSQKYEMHEVRKVLTGYLQKYSIPIERGIKQIHLLDKHNKLQAAYEEEKMKGEHK